MTNPRNGVRDSLIEVALQEAELGSTNCRSHLGALLKKAEGSPLLCNILRILVDDAEHQGKQKAKLKR